MHKKAYLLLLLITSFSFCSIAQTTYLQLGHIDNHLLDRLETRSGKLSDDLFLSVQTVSRKSAVKFLQEQRQNARFTGLTEIDRYNIMHMVSVSGEWTEDGNGAIDSKKPWFRTIYKKQPDFVYVNTDNFFLSANPVISAHILSESNNPNGLLFTSSRGMEARGRIANKVGFYTYVTDNQEGMPSYVEAYTDSGQAVPGADRYTKTGPGKYDYLLARGYIDFEAVKDHINVTFGYDRHFLGDGLRSLFLSDFAGGATFLRLNTKIWKLNYQNLFMELTPQFQRGSDRLLPHKYAAMHHLSINATDWLNIGVFEAVVFDRKDRFEFSYMIPIIFYRQIERALGSPDNVLIGLNFKALAAKHVQLYGQLILDEFTSKELFAGNGYWANKFGIQLGGKYFDAFTIKNLDIQGEVNLVRPFTYTHFDSTANYTHYNQPLAHPLGAGFAEFIGIVHYQPVKNLYITAKGMYYQRTADTAGTNLGGNIFLDYDTRNSSYGVSLVNGIKAQCALANLNLSYELRENLFIDLGLTHRRYAYENGERPTTTSTYVNGGFRLNLVRRDYTFY